VENATWQDLLERDFSWSESLAVGDDEFVTGVKMGLGLKGRKRVVMKGHQGCVLREAEAGYSILPLKTSF
jgi:hypothetical protein